MGQKFIITEQDRKYIRSLYSDLLKEVDDDGLSDRCEEWINKNFSNKIPYKESYKKIGICTRQLQEYVMSRINALKPIEHAQSFLPSAKQFYIDYFDYNKTPEIVDKIVRISTKNGKPTTKEDVIEIIDIIKKEYLSKVTFQIDWYCNQKEEDTIMYVSPEDNNPNTIFICPLNDILFVGDYEFGDSEEWKDTIQHELGHLIDKWFYNRDIFLHFNEEKQDVGDSLYSPQVNSKYNDFKSYLESDDEKFVWFKRLFVILSKYGLKINSDLKTFVTTFKSALDNNSLSFMGCSYTIENNTLIIDKNCGKLYEDGMGEIIVNEKLDNELTFLFSNYTEVEYDDDDKIIYKVYLDKMYDEWKNDYVMNQDNKQSATSAPNYPTA